MNIKDQAVHRIYGTTQTLVDKHAVGKSECFPLKKTISVLPPDSEVRNTSYITEHLNNVSQAVSSVVKLRSSSYDNSTSGAHKE